MTDINRIVLKDYHLYKNLDWHISSKPLWIIRGKNYDAVNNKRQYSGNAVGKSFIMNAIATIVLAQPPFSNRKNSAKELMPKKSSAILYGSDGKNLFEIEQKHNSKLDYAIRVNGKDKEIKDISVQRKTINKLLKLNAEHFYSFVYVHSFRPSILQIGTSSQRYDFIESLFNLQIYDKINKKLLAISNNQKVHRLQLPKLLEQSNEITITPQEQKKFIAQLDNLNKKLQFRVSKLNELKETTEKYQYLVTLFSSLKSDQTSSVISQQLKQCRLDIERTQEEVGNLQKEVGKHQMAQEIQKTKSKLLKKKAKLSKILKNSSVFTEKDKDSLLDKLQELKTIKEKFEEYSEQISKYKELDKDQIQQECRSLLLSHKNINNLIENVNKAIDERKSNLVIQNNVLDELNDLKKHSKCPTCKQTISKTSLDSLLKTTSNKKSILNNETASLKKYKLILETEQLDNRLLYSNLEETISEYNNTQQLLETTEEYLYIQSRYHECLSQLDNLPNVKDVDVSTNDLKEKTKRLVELQKKVEFLSSELRVHQQLGKEYSLKQINEIKDKYKRLKKTHSKLNNSIVPLNEAVQKLSVAVSTGKIDIDNHKRLKQEIQQVEKETQDYELIQALVEIYSPKGVRVQHIETLSESMIKLMNQYSSFIFSEPVKFSHVIGKSQFSVLAERRGKVSDVNSFSGSESRQFSALTALILRILMPAELVPNLLCLDEPEAGMSKTNSDLFFNSFLPLLQEHVKNLVIITPQDSSVVSIPNATTMLLERRGGYTTAKIG